jgi:prephenate dehydrogenase
MSSISLANPAPATLAIVGVGLIGGSVGLAARRTGQFRRIVGIGRDEASLERARRLRCVDESSTDLQFASEANVTVFCTPVDQIAAQVIQFASHCRAGALLTDAGSTKSIIVAEIDASLPDHVDFVGAHPLAGSEKRGPEHARADLFDERVTVLTPTAKTRADAVARATTFWRSLGCRIRVLAPVEHDKALAFTSHLPHLLAATLAGILPEELRELTATGFRDTTRIAAGDPALWSAILQQNAPGVLSALEKFDRQMTVFRAALASDDTTTVLNLLLDAKRTRDALGNRDPAS